MKSFAQVLVTAFVLVFAASGLNATIKPPKGHYKKAYDASMVLYGSSVSDKRENHPMCSATVFRKVQGGYLLLSAGHCAITGGLNEFPADLTYSASSDIGTPIYPIKLLKAVCNEETNVDFSVFFFPTTLKFPVIELGDEGSEQIGNKTYNFNFSKEITKLLSRGVIVSLPVTTGPTKNLVFVDQFAALGSSGSSVISEKTNRIIGIVTYGWQILEKMPEGFIPISAVKLELSKTNDLPK
jgi:hypothetical protein